MKKILIAAVILLLSGCITKEVEVGDPDLEMKGGKLYYREKLFTGNLVQEVPLTDKQIKIPYKKGKISSE